MKTASIPGFLWMLEGTGEGTLGQWNIFCLTNNWLLADNIIDWNILQGKSEFTKMAGLKKKGFSIYEKHSENIIEEDLIYNRHKTHKIFRILNWSFFYMKTDLK